MLLLKEFFLKNYYDKEKQQFNKNTLQNIDFSPDFISHILWKVGYNFPNLNHWDILELDWLISKD
jgi:hypothetical protein